MAFKKRHILKYRIRGFPFVCLVMDGKRESFSIWKRKPHSFLFIGICSLCLVSGSLRKNG